jgi:hypothetical protein
VVGCFFCEESTVSLLPCPSLQALLESLEYTNVDDGDDMEGEAGNGTTEGVVEFLGSMSSLK